MAKLVLGVGSSHSPMLNMPAADWPLYAGPDLRLPHYDRSGRRISYEELKRAADPAIAAFVTPEEMARRHARNEAAIAHLAAVIAAARLDALIVVGDDQEEIFSPANQPAAAIYWGETIPSLPFPADIDRLPFLRRAYQRNCEPEGERLYPVDAALARHLIEALVDREFDVAALKALPGGVGEGHALGFVHKRLMAAAPIVPIVLNTYYPPNQPTPRRCYRLGQAIAAAVATFPGDARVGMLASGGLSHFVVYEDLDREVMRALREKDAAALQNLPRSRLEAGSSEIRNWICLAGAVEPLSVDWLEYVPCYRSLAGTGTAMCFATWQ